MELIVYSAFWCPDCRTARRFLHENDIPYKEIDIETTPGAAEVVIQCTGKRSIPQFVIRVAPASRRLSCSSKHAGRMPALPGEGFLYEANGRAVRYQAVLVIG